MPSLENKSPVISFRHQCLTWPLQFVYTRHRLTILPLLIAITSLWREMSLQFRINMMAVQFPQQKNPEPSPRDLQSCLWEVFIVFCKDGCLSKQSEWPIQWACAIALPFLSREKIHRSRVEVFSVNSVILPFCSPQRPPGFGLPRRFHAERGWPKPNSSPRIQYGRGAVQALGPGGPMKTCLNVQHVCWGPPGPKTWTAPLPYWILGGYLGLRPGWPPLPSWIRSH